MKTRIIRSLVLLSVFFLIGCAASYKPIYPPSVNYSSHDLQEGISFSYKYDVLRERGDKRYANKEFKKNVRVVAVKLTNNTDGVLNVGADLMFFDGTNQIIPMDPRSISSAIKQITPGYLGYLLLTFVSLSVTTNSGTDYYPVGLVMGPVITLGNVVVSASANSNLQKELDMYDIRNRDIQPGETIYGIMGFYNIGYDVLKVKIR